MSKKCMCPMCGNTFHLGSDGVWNSVTKCGICDVCAGVSRDTEGIAWYPDELEHVYVYVSNINEPFTVTREEAFKEKK